MQWRNGGNAKVKIKIKFLLKSFNFIMIIFGGLLFGAFTTKSKKIMIILLFFDYM